MPNLPALTKSWVVVPNVSVSTSYPNMLFAIKVQLLAFGWSVSGSSNSTTGAMDGVDRWASSANIIKGANSSAARSWIVMRNPVGRQILLDYFGGNNFDCRVQASGGALFTGGSSTAAPTATDAFPAQANASRPLGDVSIGSFGATRKLSFMQSSDGKNLMVIGGQSGGVVLVWCIGDVVDPSQYYSTPFTFLTCGTGAVGNFSDPFSNFSSGGSDQFRFASLAPTGPVSPIAACSEWWTNLPLPINLSGGAVTVKNQISNEFPIYAPFHLTSVSLTFDVPGHLGTWPDMWPTIPPATGWASGDHLPSDGSKKMVHVADLILPWGNPAAIQLT